MKIDKTWGEWHWVNDDGVTISPRFITKQEACYWLVEFEGEEIRGSKRILEKSESTENCERQSKQRGI